MTALPKASSYTFIMTLLLPASVILALLNISYISNRVSFYALGINDSAIAASNMSNTTGSTNVGVPGNISGFTYSGGCGKIFGQNCGAVVVPSKGNDKYIVTGPREKMVVELIERFKNLFYNLHVFNDDMNTATIRNVSIEAYPSNHMDAMRSLKNPKFILLDEADFFR